MKEQTWQQWARLVMREAQDYPEHPSRLRKGALAALTGTDVRVLNAFVPILELYVRTEEPRLLDAARAVLLEMQPSTRWIARELIPFVREWPDRELLWPKLAPTAPTGDFHPRGEFANHTGQEETPSS